MADFCKQASIDLFMKDFHDLAGLCKKGDQAKVLCEECGFSVVDEKGICLGGDFCKHGKGTR